MCSVLEEDFMIEEKSIDNNLEPQICKKCKSPEADVILRKKDYYCKECFLAATTHKFRAMLGKYRIIKPNDKVLVVYRLGHPSTALLHMIRTGLDLSQHKKLRFDTEYLFIDEYEDIPLEQRKKLMQQVYSQINLSNFRINFTSLNQFNYDSSSKVLNYEEYINSFESTKDKIVKSKNLTSEQENLEINKRNLTIEIAKKLNCKVVLTPEISVDTTVGILSNIALGRGSQISLNVGIIDDRDLEVKLFTPLRLFEIEELEYYNNFYDLEVINCEVEVKSSPYDSVQNLMKKFVEDLQVNYPSTIKTVTRTGDKLTCNKSEITCKLCKAPVENLSEVSLSTEKAVNFSQIVSKNCIEDLNNYIEDKSVEDFCYACTKLKNKTCL